MKFDVAIRRILRRYYDSGRATEIKTQGVLEIKKYILSHGGLWVDYQSRIQDINKAVVTMMADEFANAHKIQTSSDEIKMLKKINEKFVSKLSDRRAEAMRIMEHAIIKAHDSGADWQTIARKGLIKLDLSEHQIETEIYTTSAAIDNVGRIIDFRSAGIKNLIYQGPEPQRHFCVEHYKKVYSIDDVNKMVNDFGEPAAAYCGGPNCHHRWDAYNK